MSKKDTSTEPMGPEPAAEREEQPTPGTASSAGNAETETVAEDPSSSKAPSGEIPSADADRSAELEQQYLRLRADFDNFRKRTIREKQEWTQRALENLAGDLLAVLDHFEMGLETAAQADTPPAVLDGFRMIQQQLTSSLAKYDIQAVEAVGKPFDHAWHEALTTMPSDDVPADHIVHQAKRGYRIGDRLLRAAQVVVSSGPADTAEADPVENEEEVSS